MSTVSGVRKRAFSWPDRAMYHFIYQPWGIVKAKYERGEICLGSDLEQGRRLLHHVLRHSPSLVLGRDASATSNRIRCSASTPCASFSAESIDDGTMRP